LIDTFRFSQKHNAHLFAFRILIDKVTKSHIYLIRSMCYVNALSSRLHFCQEFLHIINLISWPHQLIFKFFLERFILALIIDDVLLQLLLSLF
jgi:hypothetical protein